MHTTTTTTNDAAGHPKRIIVLVSASGEVLGTFHGDTYEVTILRYAEERRISDAYLKTCLVETVPAIGSRLPTVYLYGPHLAGFVQLPVDLTGPDPRPTGGAGGVPTQEVIPDAPGRRSAIPAASDWRPATYYFAESGMDSGWHQVQLAGGRLARVPLRRIRKSVAGVAIRDAASAGLVRCRLCDAGFRRVDGVHVGSQSLGMIPDTPCDRVFATCGEDADHVRPWLAHVDGEPLRKQSGEARRFGSPAAAYEAALKSSPRKWHP